MQIKEVVEQTGLTKKSIRYYEDCGLISVEKMDNGYKDYKESDIEILKKIKELRLLDFSIQEIIEYQNGNSKTVIQKRMIENQEKINKGIEIDDYLRKLLHDDEMNVEQLVLEKVEEQYKMIRYNWLFGLCNLFVLAVVVIIIWFYRFSLMEENFLVIELISCAVLFVLIYQQNRRNKELKKEGKLIYTRTKIGYVYQLISNILSFFIGTEVAVSCISSVGIGDWFNTVGNIVVSLFMLTLMLVMVGLCFVDSQKIDMEFSIN
jgi:DNA-binding transcriptional MerR regulator